MCDINVYDKIHMVGKGKFAYRYKMNDTSEKHFNGKKTVFEGDKCFTKLLIAATALLVRASKTK